MGRMIVVILDGFGVGAMEDVVTERRQDIGANTALHILQKNPTLKLKTLECLGLMNVLGTTMNSMEFSKEATYGKARLTHYGADTFFGHQEIMGTKPMLPLTEPIKNKIDTLYTQLLKLGYDVKFHPGTKERLLVVENALTIADNIECDLGQAFNVTAALDVIDFEDVVQIGRVVRAHAVVSRVIAFGGRGVTIDNILEALEEKEGGYIGINTPRSGVYKEDYHCIHLGYGVDTHVQVQTILGNYEIPVYFLGKVADVCENSKGVSISKVDTRQVLEETIRILKSVKNGFICCNVQESDLAGHQESDKKYAEVLRIADEKIGEIMEVMEKEDLLIVAADHGNDPTIGHSKHTREYVPLLIYGDNLCQGDMGIRATLSDIGATVGNYFNVDLPENGESFLGVIRHG